MQKMTGTYTEYIQGGASSYKLAKQKPHKL